MGRGSISGLVYGSRRGRLLKTGQTTQYSGEMDDGHYERGLAKSYIVYIAGQYLGTSDIDLIHVTDTTIAFAATTPGTITDTNNQLAMFKTAEVIVITGSASNDGTYNVSTGNVAGTIRTTEATLLEGAAATVSIAKREAHSNECVLDQNTGLMWSRYTSAQYATMGTGGDGNMPWHLQLYDIFQYCAAANTASLGGYADWRIPNVFELLSIVNQEAPTAVPDAATFPSWPSTGSFWISSTAASLTTSALYVSYDDVEVARAAKTVATKCALVRGG